MKKLLLISLTFVVLFSTAYTVVAAPAEDKQIAITIIGGKVSGTPTETTAVTVDEGFTVSGMIVAVSETDRTDPKSDLFGMDFRIPKGSGVEFDPPADEVVINRLDPHTSAVGIGWFKKGDSHSTEVLRDIQLIPSLGAGETATIIWVIKPEQPSAKPNDERPRPAWINPLLKSDQIIFSVTGEGKMDTIEGHTLPVIENSSSILITPIAPYLNAFDILNTRWSLITGKELELYSIPVSVWQNGDNPIDLSEMGSGEYSIVWTDNEGLLLNDPGPFPEFELSGSNISEEVRTFYAMWQWNNRKHTQGEWVWVA